MSSEEVTELMESQLEFEREVADGLAATANATRNSPVKLILNTLVLDGRKHAGIFEALIDLRSGAVVSDIDKVRMTEALNGHLMEEEEMLDRLREVLAKAEDERTKSIIRHVLNEEGRHHDMLRGLLEVVKGVEGMRDKDWWGLFYDRSEWLF